MPEFCKGPLPYIDNNTLVIPFDTPERYRWYDWDWDGKKGMSIHDILKGLDREDLISNYTPGSLEHGKSEAFKVSKPQSPLPLFRNIK